MFVTLAFVLVIAWILFVVGLHLTSWLVHLLLMAAVVLVALWLIRRSRKKF